MVRLIIFIVFTPSILFLKNLFLYLNSFPARCQPALGLVLFAFGLTYLWDSGSSIEEDSDNESRPFLMMVTLDEFFAGFLSWGNSILAKFSGSLPRPISSTIFASIFSSLPPTAR